MASPDTGNSATVSFATSSFAVDIHRISEFAMSLPVLNSSHLLTTINESYVQGDLVELSPIDFGYWFDQSFDTATIKPPFATPQAAAKAPETIAITFPLQTGDATALIITGSAWMNSLTIPELLNNQLQDASFSIQYAGGSSCPTFTVPTQS